MQAIATALGHALWMAFVMFWQIFWGLSLGFLFSAVIEIVVSKDQMARWLPDASPRSLTRAALFGAASSSCSYAAVAMARSMVRKQADFTAAIAFQVAATNLVLELGVLLWVLMGWQFAVAEFVGGPLMIAFIALLFRHFVAQGAKREAIDIAERGVAGAMEAHAAMSMHAQTGTWRERLTSRSGWVAITHNYIMNWAMLWRDIAVGVLIAGALAAWVPHSFWQHFFLTGHPAIAPIWSAFVGPLVAVLSFTCSVGNVPFASVLWRGGIGFGGVAAFVFGDLIIVPILNIYRKYYGMKMTVVLACSLYAAMVAAALIVEGAFRLLGWVPQQRNVSIGSADISWNYTTILNIAFGLLALACATVFFRSGGPEMMKSMASEPSSEHAHH